MSCIREYSKEPESAESFRHQRTFFQMNTVNLIPLMKNHLIIFLDVSSSSKKRKEKQKLIISVNFATKINIMSMDIKLINAPRLKK